MKQCQGESKFKIASEACAREILDVVPLLMRAIRAEVRRHHKNDLSIPQFRTLAFLVRQPDASLSEVSEHLGLTLPSTSKIVEALVSRKLVARRDSPADRRRVHLTVTPAGKGLFDATGKIAQAHLARALAVLSEPDLKTIVSAMNSLRGVFLTMPQAGSLGEQSVERPGE